jgi:hypothetical protein
MTENTASDADIEVVEIEVVVPKSEPEPEELDAEISKTVSDQRTKSPRANKKIDSTNHLSGVEVSLKALVYLGVPRNSASVRAVQARLLELGYVEAGSDRSGWLGPLTHQALQKFQADASVREEYCAGPKTISRLFEGTGAVVVS